MSCLPLRQQGGLSHPQASAFNSQSAAIMCCKYSKVRFNDMLGNAPDRGISLMVKDIWKQTSICCIVSLQDWARSATCIGHRANPYCICFLVLILLCIRRVLKSRACSCDSGRRHHCKLYTSISERCVIAGWACQSFQMLSQMLLESSVMRSSIKAGAGC